MLRKSKYAKLVVLSFLLLLFSSFFRYTAFALINDLPEPPTRPNTQGAVSGVGNTYSGNILVIEEKKPNALQGRDKVLGEIICSNEMRTVEVEEESDWGLSITGPLTEGEMQGVLDAIKDLRPPKKIKMSYELQGNVNEKRKWTHTGTFFEVTHYKIYIVRQAVPAENEFIGVLVVEEPVEPLQVNMVSEACAQAQPKVDVPSEDMIQGFIGSLTDFFHRLFVDLPNDLGLYVFGTVKVYSAGGIAGVMHLRSGESKTIALPPGSYNAQAVIRVFGIPFELSVGNVAADVPILLTVTLLTVEYGAYVLGVVVIIIIIIIVYKIVKRIRTPSREKPGSPNTPSTPPGAPPETKPKESISSETRGEGPGQVFGPHVRGWNAPMSDGLSKPQEGDDNINFHSYGTLKYGANVGEGEPDSDHTGEILSEAGPGQVFGPHVRGWNAPKSDGLSKPLKSPSKPPNKPEVES
jgi:hypothetical protein